VAVAGGNVSVECDSSSGGGLTLDASESADADSPPGTNDDIVLFEWFAGLGTPSSRLLGTGERLQVTLPLGVHDITLTVTDQAGATSSDETIITVVDTSRPTLTVRLSPETLWPPNHRMVPVSADIVATDICGPVAVQLVSATSSEPDDASGPDDGVTANDIQSLRLGTGDWEIILRAERSGAGDGRVYSLGFVATDGSGNTTARTALALVPHDQSGVIEPVQILVVQTSRGTVIDWSQATGALYYNVIRGQLGGLHLGTSEIELGDVTCIEAASFNSSTAGHEDGENPIPGAGFFYLVEYNDGWLSSFGELSAGMPRVIRSGGCN